MRFVFRSFLALAALVAVVPVFAQDVLPAETRVEIDKGVDEILAKSGAPSASIAVVKDGRLVYTHAYGLATLQPPRPATPSMRYSIGSISKQFTAAAILMLAEEGKISLDDRIVRWLPDLTRANEVTVRQILSMTSGYQDFWPQDYVMPMMLHPVEAHEILEQWGKKPLDFEPGTKWQYSNTNYVIAGVIVEKVTGKPLLDLLQERVFGPLKMTSIVNTDLLPLGPEDASRYLRYALGPLRPAPKEGKGWMFAAGELGMTAHDLALWDISLIDQSVLKPESYRQLEKEVPLTSGVGSHYGLGVSVETLDGRRLISHGGEVSGFTATNMVYPDERAAVVVLTNLDATNASSLIASRIATQLFKTVDSGSDEALDQSRKIFEGLQHGRIDRTLFTSNANAYFDEQAIKDFASSLGPLGTPQEFTKGAQSLRGGMILRRYRIVFPKKTLRVTTFTMPDGKLEQYQIAATE